MNFATQGNNKIIFYEEYLNKRKNNKKQQLKLVYHWLFFLFIINGTYYFFDKHHLGLTALITMLIILLLVFSCCLYLRKFMSYQQSLGYFTRLKLCNKNTHLKKKLRHEKLINIMLILTFILGAALTITDIFIQYNRL